MTLTTLEELISRYGELRSYANHGSYDNWFMKKFRLTQIKKLKLFEKIYQKTYAVPFAKSLFEREIRYDLLEIKAHFRILNRRRGKSDFDASKAIEIIDKSLAEIPLPQKKNFKQWIISMKEILIAIATLPIFTAVMSLWEHYYLIIVLVGVMTLFPLSQILVDIAFVYFSKKLWYRTIKKKLGIDELKKRLIKELITENDSSFV